jgi:hypothetical protein
VTTASELAPPAACVLSLTSGPGRPRQPSGARQYPAVKIGCPSNTQAGGRDTASRYIGRPDLCRGRGAPTRPCIVLWRGGCRAIVMRCVRAGATRPEAARSGWAMRTPPQPTSEPKARVPYRTPAGRWASFGEDGLTLRCWDGWAITLPVRRVLGRYIGEVYVLIFGGLDGLSKQC